MDKSEIIINLNNKHEQFISLLNYLDEKQFMQSVHEKWSAGQQLEHIYRSLNPLAQVLLLPKFALKLIFGKANRPSKNYEALVEKYNSKLTMGVRASGRFVPNVVMYNKRDSLINILEHSIHKLSGRLSKYDEQELNSIILPHPLLGKLTLREMMYFTIYHVEHHQNIIIRDLGLQMD